MTLTAPPNLSIEPHAPLSLATAENLIEDMCATLSGKISNQLRMGRYTAVFTHIINFLTNLTEPQRQSPMVEMWLGDTLSQVHAETEGFHKIIQDSKFNSFIYYLNIVLGIMKKDYVWLKSCLPLEAIDFLFSSIIQHNDLKMAEAFMPAISDKNLFNYPETIRYCFQNKNKEAFDLLIKRLNGVGELSVDLLIDVYLNFGAKAALEFSSEHRINPCAFGTVYANDSLLTRCIKDKDVGLLTELLKIQPDLFNQMLSHVGEDGQSNLSVLNASNVLIFKDILFSQELSGAALTQLSTFSFDIDFMKKSAGSDYYRQLFSQPNFNSKDASLGRLELYYGLCDLSFRELAKINASQPQGEASQNVNASVSVIEDFLTHYTKPLLSINNLDELTYILQLQKTVPHVIHSSLIDKVMKLRPQLVESAHDYVDTAYNNRHLLLQNTGFFQQRQKSNDTHVFSANLIGSENSANANDIYNFSVWGETKNMLGEFISWLYPTYRFLPLPPRLRRTIELKRQGVEATHSVEATPTLTVLEDLKKSIEDLKTVLENSIEKEDDFHAKCAMLIEELEAIAKILYTTNYKLMPEEAYILKHNIVGYVRDLMNIYVMSRDLNKDSLFEKIDNQYTLIKEQIGLFKKSVSGDIEELIERELNTIKVLIDSKNTTYKTLTASK